MKRLLLILVCALALSACGFGKKEAQPPPQVQPPADKQGATKARLTELFQLCKDDKKAEAAQYIDKDVVLHDKVNLERVDVICGSIKTNLIESEKYEFKEFHLDPANDSGLERATWTVAFYRGADTVPWVYTFTFIDGKYVLASEPSGRSLTEQGRASVPGDARKKGQEELSDRAVTSTPAGPVSLGILNDKAIRLVKPAYPAIARSAGAAGEVRVAVVVDEYGNVIQAMPVSGHPLLRAAAAEAARATKFESPKLNGRPVKVSGVLKFEFVAP